MEMKKIQAILFALAASLVLTPSVRAQQSVPYHEDANGVCYNKYITSETPTNGEFTVRLETFATGEVKVERKSIPSDIVLVLDMSGSMNYDYTLPTTGDHAVPLSQQLARDKGTAANNEIVSYRWSTALSVTNGYNSVGDGTGHNVSAFSNTYRRYYKDGDSFYQVTAGRTKFETGDTQNKYYYYLYYTRNNTRYYLTYDYNSGESGVTTEMPTNAIGTVPVTDGKEGSHSVPTTTLYKGQLWRYPSRIEALKEAVYTFVDLIAQNDATEVQPNLPTGTVGNQISIVRFTGNDAPVTVLPAESADNDQHTHVRKAFTPVKNDAGQSIKDAMRSMIATGNTPHDSGMKLAELLLQDLENRGMPAIHPEYGTPARLKTVVMFTDGKSEVSGRNAYKVTHDATQISYEIKNTLHGKVFSIGFNPDSDSKKFLEYLSSEYPDGLQNNEEKPYNYTGTKDTKHVDDDGKTIFYRDAGESDLSAIFESIADYSGGGNSEYGSTSLVTVDLVSHSFTLPTGADASRVKIYTAQCLGTQTVEVDGVDKEYLAFAEPVLANTRLPLDSLWVSHKVVDDEGNPVLDGEGNPTYTWEKETNLDIDNEVLQHIKVDTVTNTVSMTGFDFGKLWCGLDSEHGTTQQYDPADYPDTYKPHYRGFKLILEFPIVIKEGAIGGPGVTTNLPGSGLYETDAEGNKVGDPIIKYPIPTLTIPVNLWIQKKGLKKGESAQFTIERRLASDENSEYEDFKTILIIGESNADGSSKPVMKKLLNLNPNYYYRIKEEGWSWAYTNQAQDQGVLPTTEDLIQNPIIITNTPDGPDVKHAESVVRNVLSTTVTETSTTISSKDHTKVPTGGSGTVNP